MGKHTKSGELSPELSATTLLVSVEDLINMAMGPEDKNVVNYKLLQTVLHILARQMRLLEQRVEIKVTEYITQKEKEEKEEKERERSRPKDRAKSGDRLRADKDAATEKEKALRTAEKERKNIEKALEKGRAKEEKAAAKADRGASKDREKADKAAAKEKEREERAKSKERDKADRAASKEREKEDRGASKDRERAERAAAKDRDKEERGASKDRERAERAAAKDRDKEERGASKDRERAERAAAKDRDKEERGASKDREKAERAAAKDRDKEERGASKDRERAERAAAKDREKEERGASKDREKAERAAAKDREKDERGASKDRERAERAAAKDKEREERGASKDKEKAERAAEKDKEREERGASKDREKAERAAAKDKEREERGASKDKEKAEKAAVKDKEREERATSKEREKADKAAAKDKDRDERATSKEREKADKAAAKEREKEEKAAAKDDRATSKEREKEERALAKEREREEKATSKERDKAEKAAAKEDKAASKEREKELKEAAKAEKEHEKAERAEEKAKAKGEKEQAKMEKEQAKAEKEMTKAEKAAAKEAEKSEKAGAKAKKEKGADTGIAVTEKERDKEKVLVVEKGPTTRSALGARSNIEVVTRSQFDLLKDIITDLAEKAGPLPMPSMPQNKELLQRLSKGTASLTDMMGAMQVNARVVAAEQAIGRMGGILTQLATAGALPQDIAGQVGEVTMELEAELQEADVKAQEARADGQADALDLGGGGRPSRARVSVSRKSILSAKSRASTVGGGPSGAASAVSGASGPSGASGSYVPPKVTHPELDDAVRRLKDDLARNMAFLTAKSSATADSSMTMVKAVAEKLETAMKLNSRISTLHSMVTDYAEQLSGFDAGLTTQMQSFSEQMNQMRGDMQAGLKLLESVNNNAETAAVMELTERYEGLVTELDHTLHAHSELHLTQETLGEDLRGLIEAVEMLREQKADRDEVQDGLRDKADTSRLAGLLTEQEFAASRAELERRLAVCHDKFHRQDGVWMRAVRDLKEVTDMKADLVHLLGTREEVQRGLDMLHEMCRNLALVLGEPKAAVLTRKLTRGATCAACMAPALMEPQDASAGAPPLLPAARPPPAGAPATEPCDEFKLPAPPDTREHTCNRWVGGSHTLVSDAVSRLQAQPMTYSAAPTSRFTGYGTDGRLYMMEEDLQPCLECNKLSDEAEGLAEGGKPTVINA